MKKKFQKMENNLKRNKDFQRANNCKEKTKIQKVIKTRTLKDWKAWSNKIWTLVMNKWKMKNKILVTKKDFKTTKMKIQTQNKTSKKMNLIYKVGTNNSKMYSMILEIHPNILKRRKSLLVSHSKNLKSPSKITKRLPTNKKRKTSSQKVTKASKIKEDDV